MLRKAGAISCVPIITFEMFQGLLDKVFRGAETIPDY